jgi:hypothetical protein
MKNPGPPVAKTNRQDQNVVKNPGPPVAKTHRQDQNLNELCSKVLLKSNNKNK